MKLESKMNDIDDIVRQTAYNVMQHLSKPDSLEIALKAALRMMHSIGHREGYKEGHDDAEAGRDQRVKAHLNKKDFVNESSLPKKIFISGPMTGLPDFNFPRFNLVAKQLEDAGIDCVNPVDVCKKYKKETVLSNPAKFQEMINEQQRLERECDAILLLDGWSKSKGVRLELKTALELGMKIYLEEELDSIASCNIS